MVSTVGARFPHGLTVPGGILGISVLNSRILVAFWQGVSTAGRIEVKKSLRGKDNKVFSRLFAKALLQKCGFAHQVGGNL